MVVFESAKWAAHSKGKFFTALLSDCWSCFACTHTHFLSLYLHLHERLMGSNMGSHSSSIQVSGKSIWQFLCNASDKPTKKQTDGAENLSSSVTKHPFHQLQQHFSVYMLMHQLNDSSNNTCLISRLHFSVYTSMFSSDVFS